jgi:hypothetical protein
MNGYRPGKPKGELDKRAVDYLFNLVVNRIYLIFDIIPTFTFDNNMVAIGIDDGNTFFLVASFDGSYLAVKKTPPELSFLTNIT